MKNQLATAILLLAATLAAQAQVKPAIVQPQDKTKATPRLSPVQERAKRLSDQMAHELRLNGYQSTRLRAINEDKVAKMAAIEQKNAGNSKLIDEQCGAVCRERDQELRNVLSNTQYSAYYDSREDFYKYDKEYAKQTNAVFVRSVQNPLPASSRGATIGPARTTPTETTR